MCLIQRCGCTVLEGTEDPGFNSYKGLTQAAKKVIHLFHDKSGVIQLSLVYREHWFCIFIKFSISDSADNLVLPGIGHKRIKVVLFMLRILTNSTE
jgi:hypothetical protein